MGFSVLQIKVCESFFNFWIASKLQNNSFESRSIIIFTFSIIWWEVWKWKKWICWILIKKNSKNSWRYFRMPKNDLELFKWCFWSHSSNNFKALCSKMLKKWRFEKITLGPTHKSSKPLKPSQPKTPVKFPPLQIQIECV